MERVSRVDIIPYMLEGINSRVYGRMMVGAASQWDVVKAALLAEFAIPLQDTSRRWIARELGVSEVLDVYLNDIERLGGRVDLGPGEGLRPVLQAEILLGTSAFFA